MSASGRAEKMLKAVNAQVPHSPGPEQLRRSEGTVALKRRRLYGSNSSLSSFTPSEVDFLNSPPKRPNNGLAEHTRVHEWMDSNCDKVGKEDGKENCDLHSTTQSQYQPIIKKPLKIMKGPLQNMKKPLQITVNPFRKPTKRSPKELSLTSKRGTKDGHDVQALRSTTPAACDISPCLVPPALALDNEPVQSFTSNDKKTNKYATHKPARSPLREFPLNSDPLRHVHDDVVAFQPPPAASDMACESTPALALDLSRNQKPVGSFTSSDERTNQAVSPANFTRSKRIASQKNAVSKEQDNATESSNVDLEVNGHNAIHKPPQRSPREFSLNLKKGTKDGHDDQALQSTPPAACDMSPCLFTPALSFDNEPAGSLASNDERTNQAVSPANFSGSKRIASQRNAVSKNQDNATESSNADLEVNGHVSLSPAKTTGSRRMPPRNKLAPKSLAMLDDLPTALAVPLTPSLAHTVGLHKSDLVDTDASHYGLRNRKTPVNYQGMVLSDGDETDDGDETVDGEEEEEFSLRDLVVQNNLSKERESDSDGQESDDDVLLSIPKAAQKHWLQKKKTRLEVDQNLEEDAENEDGDRNTFLGWDWVDGNIPEVIRPPVLIPAPSDELAHPTDYFYYFFDEDIMSQMTAHTNTYSTYMFNEGKLKTQIDITQEELYKFFGIWIYMGVVKLGSMRDYWSHETYVPQVATVMTFNRFQSIKSSLHMYNKCEESCLDSNDRFRKVSPLLNHMKKKCNDLVQENSFSIDETIVPYKGKFAGTLRQYIKTKPHKFGFKLFSLAGTSGIIYDFLPYAGQQTAYRDLSEQEAEMGVGAKVVLHLCKNIDFPEKSSVYFDNYFTSVKLVSHLKSKYDLVSTGTLRKDRLEQCPLKSDAVLKKAGRGASDSKVSNDGVQLVKWLDNKIVHIASTIAGITPEAKAKRWNKVQHRRVEVQVPRAIEMYNANMGGVDLHDMLTELNRLPTKSKRWYMALVGYMVDLALVNSWLLYRRHAKTIGQKATLSSKEFRLAVSKSLRGAPISKCRAVKNLIQAPRGYRPDETVKFEGQHSPIYENTQNRCKYCTNGKTKVRCPKCLVFLCLTPSRNCFHLFHEA